MIKKPFVSMLAFALLFACACSPAAKNTDSSGALDKTQPVDGAGSQQDETEIAKNELEEQGFPFDANGLQSAILTGNIKAVELFMKAGMDPDIETVEDWPVLYTAISANQPDIITLLIQYGADVSYEYKDGGNYLWFGVMNKATDATLDALLAGGVDINYTWNGDNCADIASYSLKNDKEYQRLLEYLVSKGLEPGN